MAKLIYSAIASLDLYVADEQGKWDWAFPSEEVHAFVNDIERPIGTHLFGRRMYEVLSAWETMDDPHPLMRDYAEIWRSSDKIVYSRSLESVVDRPHHPRARVLPRQVAELKATATRTSTSAARTWPPKRSPPGSSTSATSCSARSSWAAGTPRSPPASAGSRARRPAPLRERRRAPALRQS